MLVPTAAVSSVTRNLPLSPQVLAACGVGFLAHVISNHIVQQSVQHRLSKNHQNHTLLGKNKQLAVAKAHQNLYDELAVKRTALKRSALFGCCTLMIGQLAIWANLAKHNWSTYFPTILVLGVDFAFHAFFNALDNLQDEIAPLGEPRTWELPLLAVFTGASILFLLRSNKLYFLKAASLLFGTTMAKTNDTPVWRLFGMLAFPVILAASSLGASHVPGPSWTVVRCMTIAFGLTNLSYESITCQENPWRAPGWLVKATGAGLLHHGTMCFLVLVGVYPVAWLPREVVASLVYYGLKVGQHSMNLNIIQQHQLPASTTSSGIDYMLELAYQPAPADAKVAGIAP